MAGQKTHEQQQRIVEERENTRNAGKEFDAEADLKKSPAERKVKREGSKLRSNPPDLTDPDDRNMLRGTHQESAHNKHRQD